MKLQNYEGEHLKQSIKVKIMTLRSNVNKVTYVTPENTRIISKNVKFLRHILNV